MKLVHRLPCFSSSANYNIGQGDGNSDSPAEGLPTTRSVVNTLSSVSPLGHLGNDPPVSILHAVPSQYTSFASSAATITSSLYRGRADSVHSSGRSCTELGFRIPTLANVREEMEGGTCATRVLGSTSHRRAAIPRVADNRRYGIYISNASISQLDLLQSPCDTPSFDVSQEPATIFPPVDSAPAAERHTRRRRRGTHRPENAHSNDAPPGYTALDPHPFFNVKSTTRRQGPLGFLDSVRKHGLKTTTGKMGKHVVKHMEDVGKLAKDMPTAVKGMQVKLNSKRAKSKMRWLEKRNYLSGQDRLLTRELWG